MCNWKQKYKRYIGRSLYNASGRFVGSIIALVEYGDEGNTVRCFEVGDERNRVYGRYWEVHRLDSGRNDQITVGSNN